jgi:N-methylhydantoinase A
MSRYRIGVDTGGTFTDVVALDEDSGRACTTKTPTTPADPSVGFMRGVERIAAQAGFALDAIRTLSHGTTVATNALLEDDYPGLGLVVTRGFRAILEIARQSVPDGYGNSYFWVKPPRLVPLHLVREVAERLDYRGQVLRPFDEAEAEAVGRWFRDQGITCIGVCFLHAYANAAHEQRMRDVLARVHPEASVSISSEVLPEYREYERAVTTLVDAFVKPRVGRYVEQVQRRVAAEVGPATPFYIMKSNGGVISAREVGRQPIATVLSGPAAGALGAALLAGAAGFDRVLTLDGGGTSTDVSVIEHGAPTLTTEGRVGRMPVKVPMIDIATVGTGGGSIAWRAPDGRLRVGPKSAGADPGPMCYGRGGQQPTITDAALLLGRIPPHLLGGELALDRARAELGLGALAESLRLEPVRTAAGVLEIAAWSQANAVRQVTVKRGLDVRDFLLVAFGGSGPLLAGRLVDVLGLAGALVPPDPGNVSAFGLLTVDLRNDFVATCVQRDDRLDPDAMGAIFARLEEQAADALAREGYAPGQGHLVRSADLRYFGQAWEVRVDVPSGRFDRAAADSTVQNFHAAHERAYGYSYRPQPGTARAAPTQTVEWVNLRVTGIGPITRPTLPTRAPGDGRVERARAGTRPVAFEAEPVATPVYDRARLQPDDCLPGPAIVEEFGSTTVVYPAQTATVDGFGNLLLRRA